MKNIKLFSLILILTLLISIFHFLGVFLGLYDKGIPIDVPQHILGGVIFGLIWIKYGLNNKKFKLLKLFIFITITSFAVLGSFIWEILEFMIWKTFPVFASNFKFYSPTVSEALSDIFGGFIGGILIALAFSFKNK